MQVHESAPGNHMFFGNPTVDKLLDANDWFSIHQIVCGSLILPLIDLPLNEVLQWC